MGTHGVDDTRQGLVLDLVGPFNLHGVVSVERSVRRGIIEASRVMPEAPFEATTYTFLLENGSSFVLNAFTAQSVIEDRFRAPEPRAPEPRAQ